MKTDLRQRIGKEAGDEVTVHLEERIHLDTVQEAGYFDWAHLTWSLKVLVGDKPARVIRHDAQLSLLYKTG